MHAINVIEKANAILNRSEHHISIFKSWLNYLNHHHRYNEPPGIAECLDTGPVGHQLQQPGCPQTQYTRCGRCILTASLERLNPCSSWQTNFEHPEKKRFEFVWYNFFRIKLIHKHIHTLTPNRWKQKQNKLASFQVIKFLWKKFYDNNVPQSSINIIDFSWHHEHV